MSRRTPRRVRERGEFLIALGLAQTVQGPPDLGKLFKSPSVTSVLPQPRLEGFAVRGADLIAIQAPGPFSGLLIDLGARAQFDDVTHQPSPRSRARRRVSPGLEGSEASSMPC